VTTLHPRHPRDFERWLSRYSSRVPEAWLVFQKRTSGKQTVTYRDALQEALCYGWIDSRVKTLDAERFLVRFTPRRPGSPWSKRNLAFAKALIQSGKMTPAGVAVLPSRLQHKAQAGLTQERS
jgi:uncharacterized protein YdeI (YjbR/CyaY-like superfamily)